MRALFLALLVLPLSSFAANRTLEDCKVVKVIDDNVFEEGLSPHEYPDIDVTATPQGLEVSVGAMQDWEQSKGDFISVASENGTKRYTFRRKHDSETFIFSVSATKAGRRQGKLSLKEGGEKARVIAVAYCK